MADGIGKCRRRMGRKGLQRAASPSGVGFGGAPCFSAVSVHSYPYAQQVTSRHDIVVQDDRALLQHVAACGTSDWQKAAEKLGVSSSLVILRWCALVAKTAGRCPWSQTELALLSRVRNVSSFKCRHLCVSVVSPLLPVVTSSTPEVPPTALGQSGSKGYPAAITSHWFALLLLTVAMMYLYVVPTGLPADSPYAISRKSPSQLFSQR